MCKKKYYCGNDTLPLPLVKFLDWLHHPACKTHDYGYSGIWPRIYSDFVFLYWMKRNSLAHLLKSILMLVMTPIMFLAVLFFGWKFYIKK